MSSVSSSSKYLPYETMKEIIRPFGFPNLIMYRCFVWDNKMQAKGWPMNPYATYGKEYNGVEDFLSLSPSDLTIRKMENLIKAREASKNKPTPNRCKKVVPKTSIVQQTESSVTMKNVYLFLIEEEMTSTVENILKENNLTLQDTIEIIKGLIEYYDKKIKIAQ